MDRKEKIVEMLLQNKGDSFLQHALALEYMRENDIEKAIATFENLLASNPGYTGSYYQLAGLYEQVGNRNKAIETYQNGLVQCKASGEQRAFNELKSALENLLEEDEA